jgi:branched-chain amino acid transport system substrate-binding protein
MHRHSWRGRVGLGLALLLAGTACGTRLDRAQIVSAYRGTETSGPSGGGLEAGTGAVSGAPAPGAATGADPAAAAAATPAAGGSTTGVGSGSTGAASTGVASAPPGRASSAAGTGSPTAGAKSANAGGPAGAAQPGAGQGQAATPSGGAAPGAGATPGAPAAAGGAPIVVGSVGTVSGIVGAALGPGLPAVRAWVAAVNAAGGIKGHLLKHVYADDGGDPARHQQLVRQMVERDHVIAFVFNFAPLSGQSSIDYLNKARVPVIGDSGAAQWYYESPMFFPQFTTGRPYVEAMIRAAAAETIPQGKKKLAILNCQEAQFCVDADKLWPELAPKLGYDLVFRRQTSLAQPDYTAECLAAKNAGAEVFGLAMDGNAIGRVASACGRAGFHPIYYIHHSTLLKEQASDPNTEGLLVVIPDRAYFDTSNPKVVRYQQALARFAPGEEIRQNSFAGWVAAEAFELAANRAPDPTTSAGILEGLWTFHGETLGDITLPLEYVRDGKTPQKICWQTIRAGGGKFVYTDKGKNLNCV